jgi:excisionase family DNA binding protein
VDQIKVSLLGHAGLTKSLVSVGSAGSYEGVKIPALGSIGLKRFARALPCDFLAIVDQPLTIGEVANLLKITPQTVYQLVKKRKIDAFKAGNKWRFTIDAIQEFTNSGTSIDDDPE